MRLWQWYRYVAWSLRTKGDPAGALHPAQGTYTLPLVHRPDAVEGVCIADTSLQASLWTEARAGSHSEIGHEPKRPTQGGGPGSILASRSHMFVRDTYSDIHPAQSHAADGCFESEDDPDRLSVYG